ncbi:DMT family transporter [Chitinimonas sp. BJB300]|uniref:DMT family transporter n=1 Tax=Chitinimonas sp. BJB300 TaxID=1559339 RepID=UPI000C11B6E4|nr:DMT family transporter [Chitinimonas sp. BJB300]PHV12825.1 EamA family transporter [Chitinimonas sp. BJB300]TSJ88049.1 DMT family transporter [Chitinimonas sp. BJB300]
MPVLFPLFAVLIWAGNTVVSKAAAQVLDPAAISFYRWLIALLVLTPFALRAFWLQRQAIRPHLGRFAVLALLGMVLYQCLTYYAAHDTTATNMGVICALMPLLGLLLNGLIFRQRVGQAALLGVAFSLTGVLYLLGQGNPVSLLASSINRGDVLMLIGTSAYALYGILLKRWSPPFGAWLNLYVQVMLAMLVLTPLALTANSLAIPSQGIPLVLFASVAASVVAPYFWMRGITHLGSERTTIFMNLLPLFTALIASATLGETIQTYHWIGGGLILLGVSLTQGDAIGKLWARRPQTA